MRPPPFRLERYLADLEFSVPHLLCASDCESISIGELLALEPGAADAFHRLSLGYTDTAGDPELRNAIADLYDEIEPDRVLVHGAGEEAIFTFMHAVVEPGDHVVVHHPCYQSLHELPRALGARVTLWEARPDDGWAPGLDALEAAMAQATKLLVVNLPHNPTGYHMDEGAWRELLDLAERRGAWVLSDEAYRGLEHDPADRLPAGCDLYERACSLGVLSKGYGLAGLRVGWLAAPDRRLLDRVQTLKDYTTICGSAPSEFLARVALAHGEELLRASRERVVANLERVGAFFDVHAGRFDWIPPKAGSVAYPGLRNGGDADAFCREVLEATGVLLLPGSVFEPASTRFRVGLGRKGTVEALAALDAYLAREGVS